MTGSLVLSDEITSVKENTFKGCTGLTELMIPDGVNVSTGAFNDCSGLKRVKMPIDLVMQSQFIGCTNVEEIEYTPGIYGQMYDRTIQDSSGYHAYYKNTLEYQSHESLKTVIFDEGVISIGENAYGNFGKLESVIFASTIESIGNSAFAGQSAAVYYGYKDSYCETFAANSGFTFVPLNDPMSGPDFSEADMLLPGNLTIIEEEAFMNMPVITVRCPETLTEIGAGAFRNCRNLRNIYIPAGVQTIADDAFAGCTNLIIWGEAGSYAEIYAEEKGIRFAESAGN